MFHFRLAVQGFLFFMAAAFVEYLIFEGGDLRMVCQKRLNNNAIIAVDVNGREKILVGCGLGFQIKAGGLVDETKVEKVFALMDPKTNRQLEELLKEIPVEHLKLADDIVAYAETRVKGKISEGVIVALCDHIYMAVERKKQGFDVKNMLLWDIKRFYPEEYEVGAYAKQRIKRAFGVELTEDEAGFIALHIVNAQMDLQTKTIREITMIMQEIETIVRMTFHLALDEESVYYHRFVSHLKFFAQRLFSGKKCDGSPPMAELADVMRAQYPEAYGCSRKIAVLIDKKYRYSLSEEEMMYLSIHIARIAQVSRSG